MFLHHWVEMGGFELNHHWHGINVLSILECCLLAAVLCSLLALFAIRKSKRLTILSIVGALSFATAAYAANTALSNLTASGALAGANLIYVVQTAGTGGVKATMTQVATFINSLFSGDFTVASGGAATLKNTGPGATGPLGSATVAPIVTIDAQGRTTALSSATVTPAVGSITGLGTGVATLLGGTSSGTGGPAGTISPTFTGTPAAPTATVGTNTTQLATTAFVIANAGSGTGANPTATAGPAAVNGVATTFLRSDGAPAVQLGTAAQKGIVQVDGTTITAASGVITAVPGVTSRTVTGATDTILSTDRGNVVFYNSASAIAVSQPAPSGSFAAGFFTTLCNVNTGVPTITPGSGTIIGAATFAIPNGNGFAAPYCVSYQSDATNFNAVGDLLPGSKIPSVIGTATIQSGTTYTFASTDCGTTVRFTNASAVTATIPQGLPVGCNIAVEQAAAGQVAVNGSAVTPATLHSAHSFTKTSAQWAVIGIFTESSNVAVLTGDGA